MFELGQQFLAIGRSETRLRWACVARAAPARDSIMHSLVSPIGPSPSRSGATRNGSVNSASIEKRQPPIEETGVRPTKRGEHVVGAVAHEQCGSAVNAEAHSIAHAIRAGVSC